MVYSTEKLLQDNADKVPQDLKERVEGKVATLKSAVAANNVAEMQTAMTDLNNTLQELGQAVYGQPSAGGTPPGGADMGGGGSDDGDTVEGEFREV